MKIHNKFWKNKKVLITGNTGFKGTWLSIWLNSMGANILGYSLKPNTKPSLYDQAYISRIIKTVNGDVRNNSTLAIISVSSGKVIKLYNLPSTSEFQPVIDDFNNDGKADVLVGCHDGILYDIDLNIPSSDILNK